MSPAKRNLAASVRARLLNSVKRTGFSYNTLLTHYCFERFLYRLSRSPHRDSFVLKGAMLLRVWSDQPYRATRDLDLLRRERCAIDTIEAELKSILLTPVEPDAVEFDANNLRLGAIRAREENTGVRVILPATCGTARFRLQIDVGLGDAVWPAPQSCAFPTLLDLPTPDVLAYRRETVVAEKLEAMVVLGNRNSRIKDFFDLRYLAASFEFDRSTLRETIQRTFGGRGTLIPAEAPAGLALSFWKGPSRAAEARAFARRAEIPLIAGFEEDLVGALNAFLSPILDDLRRGQETKGIWRPGGPWQPTLGVGEPRAVYTTRKSPSTSTRRPRKSVRRLPRQAASA